MIELLVNNIKFVTTIVLAATTIFMGYHYRFSKSKKEFWDSASKYILFILLAVTYFFLISNIVDSIKLFDPFDSLVLRLSINFISFVIFMNLRSVDKIEKKFKLENDEYKKELSDLKKEIKKLQKSKDPQ